MIERPALASTGAAERLSLQHQVTLSALWLGLNFQSSALLPIVVPAQVLLGKSSFNTGNSLSAGLPVYARNSVKSIAAILDRGE